jgi:hypothetical protein
MDWKLGTGLMSVMAMLRQFIMRIWRLFDGSEESRSGLECAACIGTRRGMDMRLRVFPVVLVCISCVVTFAAKQKGPFSQVPADQREALAKRLEAYVQDYRTRNWDKLYDLVSDTGKGQTTRQIFVARMNVAHGTEFANSPDLMEFRPERAEQVVPGEWDIYGCGEARREGRTYNGIAVAHAVFKHNDWFFTGWSFTEIPIEHCKALSHPKWQPANPIGWDQPMEELRGLETVPK